PLEQTILRSYKKGANIRWWLRRDDCPEPMRQFKVFFDKAFSRELPMDDLRQRVGEVAHILHDGAHYSRSTTHLGNSLISYYPSQSARAPVAGSIQKITVNESSAWLTVKRHAPLLPDAYDPFVRYPSFPARVYSSKMLDREDHIPITSVVSHVARYNFSEERAVILTLSR
ncbi:hypothetical protein C0991_009378, partial [Blastosporella zonata]